MSEKGLRVEIPVHLTRDRRARKVLAEGEAPKVEEPVPRLARLLALAWKWELQVRRGEAIYAEIARRHRLSEARVTQVCNLSLLAPDIQAVLLSNSDALRTGKLALISTLPSWFLQREKFLHANS